VIQTTLSSSGSTSTDTRLVNVNATFCSTVVATTALRVNEILPAGKQVELYFTPAIIGDCALVVAVDPSNTLPESNEANNTKSITADVKMTRPFLAAYIATNDCFPFGGCYDTLSEYNQTVSKSNEFIEVTYPISIYSGTSLGPQYLGDPIKCIGVDDDILSIGLWGLLSGFEKAIGVVPQNYFDYHTISFLPRCDLSGVVGITYCNFRGGLITEGYWTAAAHEFGHMYGLACAQEEYNANPLLGGNPASGFWVSRKTPVNNSVCFMGNGPLRTIETRWVDTPDYEHLFRKFRTIPNDPEILVVTALLHSDGSVELRPWFFLQNGEASESLPGNYAVRVLDSAGQILAEVSLPVDFTMLVEPVGIRNTDTVPLLVTVPYPGTAAMVEIVANGQVLTAVSSTTKVLHDAIDAIPDFGFDQTPDQRRQALHHMIDAIEQMLAVGNNTGALRALVNDVRPNIERWLVDGYAKTQPVQLEKSEVLAVVDAMIERVGNFGQ
jgi:hypothetical protein